MMLSRTLSSLAAAALALAATMLPGESAAQRLAVAGATPENAVAVISVNDPAVLYSAATRSRLPALTAAYMEGVPGLADSVATFLADRQKVENVLGYSLGPEALMRNTLRGADFYVLRHDLGRGPMYSSVAVLAFNDQAQALNTLTQVLDELKSASGNVGAYPATMMTLSQVRGQPFHIFPAFGLCIANKDDIIYLATSERAMREVLAAQGKDRLVSSPNFPSTMGPLAGVPGQFWAYGERGILTWQAVGLGLADPAPSEPFSILGAILASDSLQRIGIIGEITPSAVKTTRFLAAAEFDTADRNLAAAADSTTLAAAEWLPANGALTYVTANADLRAVINADFDEINARPGGEAHAQQIRETIEAWRSAMGFSIVEELFAVLDLDFGMSWSGPVGGSDWVLVSRLTDADRAGLLRSTLAEQMGATPEGEEKPRGTVTTSRHRGTELQTVTADLFAPIGGKVVSAITASGWLVAGGTEEHVKAALDREATKEGSLARSTRWNAGLSYLSRSRHAVWMVDLNAVAPIALGLLDARQPRPYANPALETLVRSLIANAGKLGTAFTATTYSSEGIRSEQVIVAEEATR